MKFVRFILKSLMFCIMLVCTFVVCAIVSMTLSLQTKEETTGFKIWSIAEDSVGLNDAVGFWGTTIEANYATYKESTYSDKEFVVSTEGITIKDFDTNEDVVIYSIRADVAGPKFRCRNWISWSWYKASVGKVLDYGVDAVASLASPVLLPTMNVKNVERYYGKTLLDFKDEIAENKKAHGAHYYEDAIEALYNCSTDADYGKWIDEYTVMYDYMFKIAKYNAVDKDGNLIYEKYFNKFVGEDRVMNSSVVLLFYTILIDIIISIWLVKQLSDDYFAQRLGGPVGNSNGGGNRDDKPKHKGFRLFKRKRK